MHICIPDGRNSNTRVNIESLYSNQNKSVIKYYNVLMSNFRFDSNWLNLPKIVHIVGLMFVWSDKY